MMQDDDDDDDDDNDDPMILNNRAKNTHVGAYHRPLDGHFSLRSPFDSAEEFLGSQNF